MRVCPQADFVSSRQSRDETGFCYGALYPQRAIITITVSGCVGSTLNTILQNDFRRRGEGQATQPTPATLVTLPTAPSPHIALRSPRCQWQCARGGV